MSNLIRQQGKILTINLSPTHIIAEDSRIGIDNCPSIERRQMRWLEGSIREIRPPLVDIMCRECGYDGGDQFPDQGVSRLNLFQKIGSLTRSDVQITGN